MPELKPLHIVNPIDEKLAQVLKPVTNLTEVKTSADSRLNNGRRPWSTKKKVLLIVMAVMALIIGLLAAGAIYTLSVINNLKSQASSLQVTAKSAYTAFKEQNLVKVKTELGNVDKELNTFTQTYHQLAFWKYVPVARSYYLDGEEGLAAGRDGLNAATTAVQAIEPYADVLGFSGEGSFTGGTAEDRLKLIIQTLEKVMPQLDSIAKDIKSAQDHLAQIDPQRYPENIQGKPVRSMIVSGQNGMAAAYDVLTKYRPVLDQMSYITGSDKMRKHYLILFQNDNELRPTGGFLTAYALVYVEDGKVTPDKSDDIYELDKRLLNKQPIPEALGRYLTTEKKWNLRDMNISPDFKTSMDTFYKNYTSIRGEPQNIDGIIAIDTEFVTHLLTVLGPVEVPGYGTFSAQTDKRCDCPQIIYVLSEIITKPTPYMREDRKGILGPLMRATLTKAYGAPRQQWPALFEGFFNDISSRHIQFYFPNAKTQTAVESLGAAGRMTPPENTDFLAVVNANLGGAKSNLFVNSEMTQTIEAPAEGYVNKKIEITYKNPRGADNCNLEAGQLCLNSTLRDWTRIYLPKGTQLVEASGFTATPKQYDEAGFNVIDGFFILEPKGTAKIRLTVKVPYTDAKTYRYSYWKQGGVTNVPILLDVNGSESKLDLSKDLTGSVNF